MSLWRRLYSSSNSCNFRKHDFVKSLVYKIMALALFFTPVLLKQCLHLYILSAPHKPSTLVCYVAVLGVCFTFVRDVCLYIYWGTSVSHLFWVSPAGPRRLFFVFLFMSFTGFSTERRLRVGPPKKHLKVIFYAYYYSNFNFTLPIGNSNFGI